MTAQELRGSFERQGAGHKQFADQTAKMVTEGTLRDADRDILLEAFHGTDDAYLKSLQVASNPRIKQMGLARVGPRLRMATVKTAAAELNEGVVREGSAIASPEARASVVALHELGHVGHRTLLSDADRAVVDRVYRTRTARRWADFFGEGLTEFERNTRYFAKNPDEFFAQSFAEYVLARKISDARMRPLLERVADFFRKALERLRGRERLKEIEPLYEMLLAGKRPEPTGAEAEAAARGRETRPPAREPTRPIRETKPPRAETPPQKIEPPPELTGARGRSAPVVLPDGRELPATYRLAEAQSLTPSHNPLEGFRRNPAGDVNERPYEDPTEGAAGRARVYDIAQNPDPRLLLTDTPTATDGPPIVTPNGVVLGGNARTMAMQVAYSRGGEPAQRLRNALAEAAGRFGLDPGTVQTMRAPVLVREVAAEHIGAPGELSRILNQPLTAGRSAITDAVSRGRKLGEEGAGRVAEAIGDRSIREALADPKSAQKIVQAFRESGAFSDAEIASLSKAGELTDQGKSAVEQALLGAAVGDVRTLAEAPPSVERTLIRALPAIVRLNRPAERGGDPTFRPTLALAMEGMGEMRRSGTNLAQLLQEMTLTPQKWREDERAISLMRSLESSTPTAIAKRLADYAAALDDVASGQARLDGTVPTREEAWDYTMGRGFTAGSIFDPEQGKLFPQMQGETGAQRPLFRETERPPAPPPTAPASQESKLPGRLRELLDRLDDPSAVVTPPDIADGLEEILQDHAGPNTDRARKALEDFRQEQADDRELSGRGDMDAAERRFLGTLEEIAATPEAKQPGTLPGERPPYLAGWTDAELDKAADDYISEAAKLEAKAAKRLPSERTDLLSRAESRRADAARLRSYVQRSASRILAADDPQRPGESDAEYAARIRHRAAEEDTGNLFTIGPDPDADERDPAAGRRLEPDEGRQYNVDALGFYRRSERVLAEKVQGNRLQPGALAKAFVRHGVTKEELRWSGLEDLLTKAAAEGRRLTRDEVRRTIEESTPRVSEIVKRQEGEKADEIAEAIRQRDAHDAVLRNEIRRALVEATIGEPPKGFSRFLDEASATAAHHLIAGTLGPITDERARGIVLIGARNAARADAYDAAQTQHPARWSDYVDTLERNLLHEHVARIPAMFAAREAAAAHLRSLQEQNIVTIQGAGRTRYSTLTLPGGQNYREILFTLPELGRDSLFAEAQRAYEANRETMRLGNPTTRLTPWEALAPELRSSWVEHVWNLHQRRRPPYEGPHWNEQNVLAHLRTTDRTDAKGRRTLFLEEIQSDWHQQGRQHGYAEPGAGRPTLNVPQIQQEIAEGRGTQPPPAPLSENWWQTFFRRAVRMAAEQGYDAIGWTTGEQQGERYGAIVRGIDRVRLKVDIVGRNNQTRRTLVAEDASGRHVGDWAIHSDQDVADIIGPERAARLLRGEEIRGEDLSISSAEARGLADFYDRQLVDYAKKYGKRWGAKYQRGEINTGRLFWDIAIGHAAETVRFPAGEKLPIHILEITDPMRDSVMGEGQSFFGPDPLAEPGAKERLEEFTRDAVGLGRGILEGGKAIAQVLYRYGAQAQTRVRGMAGEIERQGAGRTEQARAARARADELERKAEDTRAAGNAQEADQLERLASRLRISATGAQGTARTKVEAARRVRDFAGQLVKFSQESQAKANIDIAEARKILGELSAKERRQLALLGQGRLQPLEVPANVRDANERMLQLMDHGAAGMHKAGALGLRRRTTDGQYIALGGAGEWYPQRLNSKGLEVAREMATKGITSPKLEALAQRMVDEGRFNDLDQARRGLAEYLTSNLSGKNPYFEQVRVKLPAEYIDLDAANVIEGTIRRNAKTVAAGETFGGYTDTNDVAGVEHILGDIAYHLGKPTRAALEEYLRVELGHSPTTRTNERRLVGSLMRWQTVAKLGNLITPIRDLGQPWINSADYGLFPRLKAYFAQYPLGIAELTPWGREARREAERAGAVSGQSALLDAPDLTARGAMQMVTDFLTLPLRAAHTSNQVRAYHIGKNAAMADVARLIDLEGKNGRLRQLLRIAGDPSFGKVLPGAQAKAGSAGIVGRRLGRLGLDPEKLSEIVANGRPLTPAELRAAGYLMAHDTQFLMTTASKPLWWESNPWLRLVSQFKSFGIRQTGLMLERGLKEAALGNPLPLARFGVAALVFGELLGILKDYILGTDKSISGLAEAGQQTTAYRIAKRAASHLAAGGFFGVLSDTNMGIVDYLLGPTAATARDVVQTAIQVAKRPTGQQAGMGVRDLLDRQVPLTRQVSGIIDRAGQSQGRAIKYAKLRNEVREFTGQGAGAAEDAIGELERRTLGPEMHGAGPAAYSYRFAARAITAGDLDAASDYLYELMRGAATPEERKKVIDGIKRTMELRAPLGGVDQAEARRFLASQPDKGKAAGEFHRTWVRDYQTALKRAALRLREELKPAPAAGP